MKPPKLDENGLRFAKARRRNGTILVIFGLFLMVLNHTDVAGTLAAAFMIGVGVISLNRSRLLLRDHRLATKAEEV